MTDVNRTRLPGILEANLLAINLDELPTLQILPIRLAFLLLAA